MNIDVIAVGKTDSTEVQTLVADYLKRLNFHTKVAWVIVPDLRNRRTLSESTQCVREGEMLLRQMAPDDYVVLLDEHGEQMPSVEFAQWVQKRIDSGVKRLCFVIGGPYGFSEAVYDRANALLSLSAMTFSHQIVRALFAEQLYRAFTIIRNEPYHHA